MANQEAHHASLFLYSLIMLRVVHMRDICDIALCDIAGSGPQYKGRVSATKYLCKYRQSPICCALKIM